MRILYFVYALEGGGAERQLKYLLNAHRPHITRAVCYVAEAGAAEIDTTHTERFHIPKKHKFDLRWRPITQLIRKWQPDIVVNWVPYVLSNTALPARRNRVPVFISCYRAANYPNSLRRIHQAISHTTADAIASNIHGDDLNTPFRQIFKRKPNIFVPNGFDVARVRAALPVSVTEFGLDRAVPTVLYVGRLAAHKNVSTLITAIQQLRDAGTPVQLLICGTGATQAALQAQVAAHNLENLVVFAGYRQDVFGIMQGCQLLAHPSREEGMPNVLIEAMAAGLPVVASAIAVHVRWLQHGQNGLLFAVNNSRALAENIGRMLNDTALREACLAAGSALAESLTIEQMAGAYESWYARLLADKND